MLSGISRLSIKGIGGLENCYKIAYGLMWLITASFFHRKIPFNANVND